MKVNQMTKLDEIIKNEIKSESVDCDFRKRIRPVNYCSLTAHNTMYIHATDHMNECNALRCPIYRTYKMQELMYRDNFAEETQKKSDF